jgi:hypothetical protein
MPDDLVESNRRGATREDGKRRCRIVRPSRRPQTQRRRDETT